MCFSVSSRKILPISDGSPPFSFRFAPLFQYGIAVYFCYVKSMRVQTSELSPFLNFLFFSRIRLDLDSNRILYNKC